MNALKGIVKNRQVVVEVPTDWPEGCEVVIEPVDAPKGISDEEGPMTEEEIKAVLAAMKRIEPLVMTTEEVARWKADLKAQREHDEAAFEERAEKSRRIWE